MPSVLAVVLLFGGAIWLAFGGGTGDGTRADANPKTGGDTPPGDDGKGGEFAERCCDGQKQTCNTVPNGDKFKLS